MKVEKISSISSISKQRGVPDKGKESFRDALKRAATAKKDTFTLRKENKQEERDEER